MAARKNQTPNFNIQGENVIGMLNATGSAKVNIKQKVIHQTSPALEQTFKRARQTAKTRQPDSKASPAKVEAQVKKIEAEAAKGERADASKLERWLKTLARMAPDIVDVMAASLAGPVSGFTAVFKKIVERARTTAPAET